MCVLDATGRTVYNRGCARAVTPASVQKLIVAAAAFHTLGALYRFHTQFIAGGSLDRSALRGDLWLVGSGDPILVSNDLRGGIKRLHERGVRTITGTVRVDASALRGPERNPLWDPADATYGFSAATSGVSLDQDTIEVHVRPATAGAPARVFLEPPSRLIRISSSVLTAPAGFGTSISVDPGAASNTFAVQGRIAAGAHETVAYVPVSDIAEYVGTVLVQLLQARAIAVRGFGGSGIAPAQGVVLWDHRSPPLRFIVSKMLFESNNHIAEQLLRTLGRAGSGAGDDRHGVSVEERFLNSEAIPTGGMRLVDGSGLSASNRISAQTIAAVLSRSERLPGGNPLFYALPRAGVDGTLRWWPFTTARGRVRAKSGHLSGASALAGYVPTRRHGRLVFAFIIDGTRSDTLDRQIAQAVDLLAEI